MITAEDIKQLLAKKFMGDTVEVEGDDGVHFSALIVSDLFAGLSRIKRHQLVYQVLGDRMKQAIHALQLKTMTSAEKEKRL